MLRLASAITSRELKPDDLKDDYSHAEVSFDVLVNTEFDLLSYSPFNPDAFQFVQIEESIREQYRQALTIDDLVIHGGWVEDADPTGEEPIASSEQYGFVSVQTNVGSAPFKVYISSPDIENREPGGQYAGYAFAVTLNTLEPIGGLRVYELGGSSTIVRLYVSPA